MKQNPFSFYDFLGYMLPGALLLYIATFLFGFNQIIISFNSELPENSTYNQIFSFIPAVIISYLIGHILSIGSSALIEAFTNYSNGYPSEFLFNVEPKKYLSSDSTYGNVGRIILWCSILPISMFKFFLKDMLKIKMFNQAKSLPKPLREATFYKCKMP